ncbi:MAG: hypothetical protein ACXVGB_04490 [Mycobacteriaceae bacterium]
MPDGPNNYPPFDGPINHPTPGPAHGLITEILGHLPPSPVTGDQHGSYSSQQAAIRNEQQPALAGLAGGEVVPPAITAHDNFDAMSHQDMWKVAQNLDFGQMHGTADVWGDMGKVTEPAVADFGRSVSNAIAGGWNGQGADAAANVTGEYVARGNELAAALKLTSTNFHLAAVGASETRARVQPPTQIDQSELAAAQARSVVNPMASLNDLVVQVQRQEEARKVAVGVMEASYTPVYVQSDTGVPVLPVPVSPLKAAGAGGTGSPSSTGSAGGGYVPGQYPTGQAGGGSGQSSAAFVPRSGGRPGGVGGQSVGGAAGGNGAGAGGFGQTPGAVSSAGGLGSANTVAAGMSPEMSGLMAGGGYGSGADAGGYGPNGYGAGGLGGVTGGGAGGVASFGPTGSGGYGGGGSAGSAPGTGGAGSAMGRGATSGIGGSAAMAEGAGLRGGGAAGGVSGRGGAGMGGGMGGGGAGKGDEDYEHNTPSYLITQEHGSEIVGELPRVSPAVIGE